LNTKIIAKNEESEEYSTSLQTPSPLTRLKQQLICNCGST
jgi:hypothetical protein